MPHVDEVEAALLAEVRALRRAVDSSDGRTGSRYVGPEANAIEITRGWDDVEGPVDPKSEKGKRRVPIASELRRLLIEHKMRTGRDGDDLGVREHGGAAVYPDEHEQAR